MATNPIHAFNLPSPYQTDLDELARREQLVKALRDQSLQPPETFSYKGIPARVSPFSYLAKALQGYTSAKDQREILAERKALGERARAQSAEEGQAFSSAFFGTPGSTERVFDEAAAGGEGAFGDVTAPGVAPDRRRAMDMAMGSINPMVQSAGSSLMAQMFKPAKWEKIELPTPEGGKRVGVINVNADDPIKTFIEGGTQPPKLESSNLGGSVGFFNPYAPTNVPAANIPTTAAVPPGFTRNEKGELVAEPGFIAGRSQIAAAGAPKVNVNTEKTYFDQVAQGLAKDDVGVISAGRSSPARIASARRIIDTLKRNPITGTGAEARLILDKGLATAGLIDPKKTAATESLASALAAGTLEAIKSSGLGSGQGFTDKDRDFLERAKSGNISINSATLLELAQLNEKAARESIIRANIVMQRVRGAPGASRIASQLEDIVMPPDADSGVPGLNLSPAALKAVRQAQSRGNKP